MNHSVPNLLFVYCGVVLASHVLGDGEKGRAYESGCVWCISNSKATLVEMQGNGLGWKREQTHVPKIKAPLIPIYRTITLLK